MFVFTDTAIKGIRISPKVPDTPVTQKSTMICKLAKNIFGKYVTGTSGLQFFHDWL
jgi:hypothetical protein